MLKLDKQLSTCITGEGDIFHELKKLRKVNDIVATTIDGTKVPGFHFNQGRRSYRHRKATLNLKSNRNDPLFMFNTDCLKNAPLVVFEHLKYIIKSFLMHSHVSNAQLLATSIPLPKDNWEI